MDKMPPPPQYPSGMLNCTRRRSVTYRYCPSASSKKGYSLLKTIPEYTVNKQSEEYQTISWKVLENSISNLIKHMDSGAKAKEIKKKIIRLNILRCRGILCKHIMEAQLASTNNTYIYALFIALLYNEFPSVGELILVRCIQQFKDANETKEKCVYLASILFISYLINYDVVSPHVAIEILMFLVNEPDQASIDAVFVLLNTCGYKLNDHMKEVNEFLSLTENKSGYKIRFLKKIRRMIRIIMNTISHQNRLKAKPPEISRDPLNISLKNKIDPEYNLDSYIYDQNYEATEHFYSLFRDQVLETDIKDEYILMYDHNTYGASSKSQPKLAVKHTGNSKTDKNLKSLKNLIQTLMVSVSFKYENVASKLMKIKLLSGQEEEICCLFLELCCENDVYTENLGHITQIFCQLNRLLIEPFEKLFVDTYAIINSFDPIKLHNVAKYFAQLLYSDTISWMVLSTIQLNEIQTTAFTGNFVKHLFHELIKHMGEESLNYYIMDPTLKDAFEGMFCGKNQKHSNFSVDFFSSIGLDGLIYTFQNSLIFQSN